MDNCEHDKVYDTSIAFMSDPPKAKWICKKCGCEGYGVISVYYNEYEYYKNKFQKEKEQ